MADCDCGLDGDSAEERRVLRLLLAINAVMFVVEAVAGVVAGSAGLLADSLDMLADAAVYALALYAVGRTVHDKARAARASGIAQVALGVGVLLEVGRRLAGGSEPEGALMVAVGMFALAANLACMALLARHRHGAVHMRASWLFSTSDVLANLGVIVSGVLVAVTASRLPDLAIGLLVALLVVRGGFTILREAREAEAG